MQQHIPLRPAHFLLTDERVQWLWERDEDKPMLGPHRYQYVEVRRGEKRQTFKKELGPSALFAKAHPFNFWAAGLYSLGEATEQAEWLREAQPEVEQPSNIAEQYRRQLEEKQALRRHRTVVGPAITIAR